MKTSFELRRIAGRRSSPPSLFVGGQDGHLQFGL